MLDFSKGSAHKFLFKNSFSEPFCTGYKSRLFFDTWKIKKLFLLSFLCKKIIYAALHIQLFKLFNWFYLLNLGIFFIEFFTMDQIFRTLLIRYQNYLLEFYQLIEDKELIEDDQLETSQHVKKFLENMPELAGAFEIAFSITKEIGGMQTTWS